MTPTHQAFMAMFANKLVELYQSKIAQKPTAELKANLNGFMEAALILKISNTTELQKIIDDEYFKIYGKHRRDRDDRLDGIDLNEVDWAYFDKPKWER